MSYITNADIQERLGGATYVQLADDDGDGVGDAGVVDEVRLAAEGEVDAILARRFAVPIDVVAHPELADVLKSIALDLAEYRLWARRPPIAADAVRRRGEAMAWLERIADGRADLPSVATLAPNAARGIVARAVGEERVLSRDELADV